MPDIPISYPGRYAPGVAVNFADSTGAARIVSVAAPLPVSLVSGSAGDPPPPPLSGTTAAAVTMGPYAPALGRPIVLSLTGTWTGTVTLLRSTDGGATRLPLSVGGNPWAVFTRNVCEPVWEETEAGAVFYLQLQPSSGAVSYRVSQ